MFYVYHVQFEETVYLICTISFPHSLNKTLSIIPGISLTSLLSEKQKEFDDKFKKCFSLSDEVSNSHWWFCLSSYSNILLAWHIISVQNFCNKSYSDVRSDLFSVRKWIINYYVFIIKRTETLEYTKSYSQILILSTLGNCLYLWWWDTSVLQVPLIPFAQSAPGIHLKAYIILLCYLQFMWCAWVSLFNWITCTTQIYTT